MHLTEIEIAAFIDKKLNGKQREKVLNHLSSCQKCYDNFAEVLEIVNLPADQNSFTISSDIADKSENLVKKSYHKKNIVKVKIGIQKFATALIIAAFGISVFLFQSKLKNANVGFRSGNNIQTLGLLTPADNSINNFSQLNFSWASIRGTNYYIIKIYDTIGNTVFEKSTKNIHIKPTRKIKLLDGKKYLWQIFALLNGGKKVGSRLYAFTYKK